MKVGLYSIYDRVAKESGPVFQAKNDDVAVRATCSLLSSVDLCEDYILYRVGTFDAENHIIDDCDVSIVDYEITFMSQRESLQEVSNG